MNKLRRFVMWFGLILIGLLTVLSVVGAFYGAEKASLFFNSLPLTVYWLTLIVFLIVGLVTFRRLIRVPGLLLIHLGCVFILIGSMWGSERGHRLQKKLFGIDKVPFGYMMIYEQTAKDSIVDEDDIVLARLPFSIYLDDFRIEYYKSRSYLQVENKDVSQLRAPVKDYFSDVILLEGKKQITKKSIEVNHPIHYGGYHFYQHSYDPEKGQYTILTVYSDSGLNLVYAGYLMLCSGILWHFWFKHFIKFFKRSQNGD